MKEQQLREDILKLYRLLACAMIDHGELLETDVIVATEGIQIKARAEREDHGRLVGKGGATFRAFRTIFGLIGYRHKIAVRMLPLQDPIHGERAIFQPPMTPAENWDSTWLKSCVDKTLDAILSYAYEMEVIEDEIDRKTIFVVHIDGREQLPLPNSELLSCLGLIFSAIGKNKGRNVVIASERPQASDKTGEVEAAHARLGTVATTSRTRRK